MSKPLILQYYNNLDRSFQFSKSTNEETVKSYTWMLLNDYARKNNYEVSREVWVKGTKGPNVKPDGVLKNLWGLDIGYWESKDEKDVIDDEINVKLKKGYPFSNILFEDTKTAVLFQRGEEMLRIDMREPDELDKIIKQFINFKNDTVYKFEDAIEKFKADIPAIVEALRKRIEESGVKNAKFTSARNTFLELCQAEINPEFSLADIREMMIQHLLTSDIFNKIFDDPDFHRHNTIAAELEKLIDTLFTYSERRNLLSSIEHYYDTINATAAAITDHHEKQKFLKVLYENFYKVYNPKAADRLGVVYTPNEIVKFMIQSTDYLLHKHFGKTLSDKNVEILDPATGTGTFICDIIEHIPKQHLAYKYKNELHANEVAILPYYISNLNIEYTFKQWMGYYDDFTNSCFVDTLDNTEGLSKSLGGTHNKFKKSGNLFALSSENAERIKKQNAKKISVVIGNPPYNAKQPNYNYQNSNKGYRVVDQRIKETYIKFGTAQNQIVVYDMYVRFFRWATDRLKDDGIVCFITNNNFINGRAFDGFRRSIQEEFDHAYFIDLGGNIRELSGKDGIWLNEENTIFGVAAAVGISIAFLIKKRSIEKHNCRINYIHPCDIRATRSEKLEFLRLNKFEDIAFELIKPDKNNNWINQTDNDWDTLIALIDKAVKTGSSQNAIFKNFSNGIKSQRDEWVYDFDSENLMKKITFFIQSYESQRLNKNELKTLQIKWDRELNNYLTRNIHKYFEKEQILYSNYRPFVKEYFYFDKHLNGMTYQWFDIFKISKKNKYISIPGLSSPKDFHLLAFNSIVDLNCLPAGTQCIPLSTYDKNSEVIDNITDWGLEQFRQHYFLKEGEKYPHIDEEKVEAYLRSYHEASFPGIKYIHKKGEGLEFPDIQKEDIFHYVYGVLHNPAYRKKYELNLKREFPRIPFYEDFWKWAKWGEILMQLHIDFETVDPYQLNIVESETKAAHKREKEIFTKAEEPESLYKLQPKIKAKLKADKTAGIIELDELTFITGIPKEAWEYKLGNRSALEWILDQYKEKKPSDPTILEKFNTYRFADYKDKVIDLIQRVTTVSVETMKVVREMEKEK